MDNSSFDLIIVGGGLVGCSLAAALADSRLRMALVEAGDGQTAAPPGFDERNLALARASLDALQALDVLPRLPRPPAPLRQIHVSRQGDFGAVRLRAEDSGVAAFGAVVMARDLGLALEARLRTLPQLQRCQATRVQRIEAVATGWRLQLQSAAGERWVETRLLVGADGSRSAVRTALGIESRAIDYAQQLFVCSLRAERPAADQAWERFSDSGPVALLPRHDGSFGAVCGVASAQADAVAALGDDDYRDYLQQRFGYRAGRFRAVGRRSRYPLIAELAAQLVGVRGVLLGNAAQTLHPVGAQGFNLGLRDALHLAEVLAMTDDPGAAAALADYAARRQDDRARTIAFSDGLARFTARAGALPQLLRSLGLLALDRLPTLRQPLVQGAMGYRGRLPALARAEA